MDSICVFKVIPEFEPTAEEGRGKDPHNCELACEFKLNNDASSLRSVSRSKFMWSAWGKATTLDFHADPTLLRVRWDRCHEVAGFQPAWQSQNCLVRSTPGCNDQACGRFPHHC